MKWSQLGAGEVALVEGVLQVRCDWWRAGHVTTVLPSDWLLQVLVFSALFAMQRRRRKLDQEKDEDEVDSGLLAPPPLAPAHRAELRKWGLVSLRGLLTASMSFVCVVAVRLMPIGDLIVLAFTSPVFSVVMDAVFLQRRLTLLSVTLCLLIGTNTRKGSLH